VSSLTRVPIAEPMLSPIGQHATFGASLAGLILDAQIGVMFTKCVRP
jgi:hypothetical protein